MLVHMPSLLEPEAHEHTRAPGPKAALAEAGVAAALAAAIAARAPGLATTHPGAACCRERARHQWHLSGRAQAHGALLPGERSARQDATRHLAGIWRRVSPLRYSRDIAGAPGRARAGGRLGESAG